MTTPSTPSAIETKDQMSRGFTFAIETLARMYACADRWHTIDQITKAAQNVLSIRRQICREQHAQEEICFQAPK